MGFQFHYTAYFPPTLFIQYFMLRKIILISVTSENRYVEPSRERAVQLLCAWGGVTYLRRYWPENSTRFLTPSPVTAERWEKEIKADMGDWIWERRAVLASSKWGQQSSLRWGRTGRKGFVYFWVQVRCFWSCKTRISKKKFFKQSVIANICSPVQYPSPS